MTGSFNELRFHLQSNLGINCKLFIFHFNFLSLNEYKVDIINCYPKSWYFSFIFGINLFNDIALLTYGYPVFKSKRNILIKADFQTMIPKPDLCKSSLKSEAYSFIDYFILHSHSKPAMNLHLCKSFFPFLLHIYSHFCIYL